MQRFLVVVLSIVFCSCSVFEELIPISNETECRMPCFHGIVPGETSYQQALEIVASSNLHSQGTNIWYINEDGARIDVRIVRTSPTSGNYVSYIELTTQDLTSIMSLGDLIDYGYLPVAVYRGQIAGPNAVNLMLVFGEDGQIIAHIQAVESVRDDSPVTHLVFLSSQDRDWILEDMRNLQGFDEEISWLGYAPVEQYRN